ncbi:Transcriptional regulator, LysR family [Serratia proteamaculans]|uniref:LysR family transcriptional regulator n=1 Tax=Serratia proteamaculans TaxID=28151 RepID=UPI0009F7CBE6|nr:LysR family transcriptional regulator [Serratia proteamaculans]SMB41506.1 Transcriptional regulator, LysR family [Serratia proteamaculans]
MLGNLHNVDIRLLQIFITIVQCHGFSAAQAQLNMSQSAISTCMSTLETRLGFRLCERGKKGFRLTEEGEQVLYYTQQLFAKLDAFVLQVHNLSGQLRGELMIGLLDSTLTLPEAKIVEAIRRFYHRNHTVSLQVFIKSPTELEQAIISGELHAAISYSGHRLESLEYLDLFSERISIYCGKHHPLYLSTRVTTEDLLRFNWVKRGYLMPSDLVPITPPFITATAHQMEAVAFLVLAGSHIGYLPQHYAQQWVDKQEMYLLNSDELSYVVTHCLILHRNRPHNEALDAFVSDILMEHELLCQ